jgi:hypothetical protein
MTRSSKRRAFKFETNQRCISVLTVPKRCFCHVCRYGASPRSHGVHRCGTQSCLCNCPHEIRSFTKTGSGQTPENLNRPQNKRRFSVHAAAPVYFPIHKGYTDGGAKNATFCAIFIQKRSFYQDRLGTNIMEPQKRVVFFLGVFANNPSLCALTKVLSHLPVRQETPSFSFNFWNF